MPKQDIQLISSTDTQEEVDLKESLEGLGGSEIPTGVIVMWSGTLATIPSGWALCDGNNGTPNLIDRFVQGVATAATNPGGTGGATSKTVPASATAVKEGTGDNNASSVSHAHSIADIRPKYYEVAFIMKL